MTGEETVIAIRSVLHYWVERHRRITSIL